jgi:pilus assembly protein Flp/PilA
VAFFNFTPLAEKCCCASGIFLTIYGYGEHDCSNRCESSIYQSGENMNFLQDENGATAIEYGLIAALIAVAIIGAVTVLGQNLNNTFQTVSNSIQGMPVP